MGVCFCKPRIIPISIDSAYALGEKNAPVENPNIDQVGVGSIDTRYKYEALKSDSTIISDNATNFESSQQLVQISVLDSVRLGFLMKKQFYSRLDKQITIEGVSSYQKESNFAAKGIKFSDDSLDLSSLNRLGFSVLSVKGRKECFYNQDDYTIILDRNKVILGVFDGHGADGHKVSSIARSKLPGLILHHEEFATDLIQSFEDSFEELNKLLTRQVKTEGNRLGFVYSGTTATIAIIQDGKITIANVGDSRAVLAKRTDAGYEAIRLSYDHKPEIPHEMFRIQNKGGEVLLKDNKYRVYSKNKKSPGLNLSRALGDKFAQSIGVIAKPSIFMHRLKDEDEYLIICSDGVWEHISDSEAVNVVRKAGANAKKATEDLNKLACSRWNNKGDGFDDITVMVCYLKGN